MQDHINSNTHTCKRTGHLVHALFQSRHRGIQIFPAVLHLRADEGFQSSVHVLMSFVCVHLPMQIVL